MVSTERNIYEDEKYDRNKETDYLKSRVSAITIILCDV